MKHTSEIQSAIDCIKYYNARIKEFSHQQFVEDCNLGNINTRVGSIRFDALAEIGAGCGRIDLFVDCIMLNLLTAEKQDKALLSAEEKEKEE